MDGEEDTDMSKWPVRSQQETPDVTGRPDEPWWARAAISLMEKELHKNMDVAEWGSGASTLWLARRCGSLISVDNNPGYYNLVNAELRREGFDKVRYCAVLRPLNHLYWSCVQGSYDVIIVDGRMRVACCLQAIKILKPGGLLLLDNAERPRYRPAVNALSSWRLLLETDNGMWKTNVWRKPDA